MRFRVIDPGPVDLATLALLAINFKALIFL
jgi:hypothetical protein